VHQAGERAHQKEKERQPKRGFRQLPLSSGSLVEGEINQISEIATSIGEFEIEGKDSPLKNFKLQRKP
jgi:hypothetical protein